MIRHSCFRTYQFGVQSASCRIVALHPLRPKVAEVEEINRTVCRHKVRILAIARCDTIGMQPVVGHYPKVLQVNVTIAIKV